MRPNWIWRLSAAALLGAVLAYFAREAISKAIVLPLSYAWWVAGVLFRSVPQMLFWILGSALVLMLFVDSLLPRLVTYSRALAARRVHRGQVEALAEWILNAPRGTYLKWLVANRLGKTAREILAQRDGEPVAVRAGPLAGRDWAPPNDVARFLDSGVNASFADFPRRRGPWSPPPQSPLDLDPEVVIRYLEGQMGDVA